MKRLILKSIKIYQIFISPVLGRNCRFYPSCSQYCYLAVEKYGAWKGVWQGLERIIRCHPWHKGGKDMP